MEWLIESKLMRLPQWSYHKLTICNIYKYEDDDWWLNTIRYIWADYYCCEYIMFFIIYV